MHTISNSRNIPNPTQTPARDLRSQESTDKSGLSLSRASSEALKIAEKENFSTKEKAQPYEINVRIRTYSQRPNSRFRRSAILIHFSDRGEGLCTRVCYASHRKEQTEIGLTYIYGKLLTAGKITLGTELKPIIQWDDA